MNSTLSSYLLSAGFMIIILGVIAIRAYMAIYQKNSRNKCLMLIATTGVYVLVDAAFIICHFSQKLPFFVWDTVAFFFYLVYVLLPFVWYIFVRNFVGSTFGPLIRRIEWIPLGILLGMVVVTPFTNLLWSVSSEGAYSRGAGFLLFSSTEKA